MVAVVVAALNEILLPLTFAAVLAVVFKPMATALTRRRLRPSLAAGIVVLGLLALGTVVMVATAKGVVDQLDQIGPRPRRRVPDHVGLGHRTLVGIASGSSSAP